MRDYELTVILKKEDGKAVAELLTKAGAKVTRKTDLEKKNLAYEIAALREGFYGFYELQLKPEDIAGLDQKLKLQENIIRYLIVAK